MTSTQKEIRERRLANESTNIICSREISENIKRIFKDEPLTRPLRVLRENCQFIARYNLAWELKYGDPYKVEAKKYRQRPEVKQKTKEYHKKYMQRPEIKEMRKRYLKKYRQKIKDEKKKP